MWPCYKMYTNQQEYLGSLRWKPKVEDVIKLDKINEWYEVKEVNYETKECIMRLTYARN